VPGLLSVAVLHASTVGAGNHSRSEASVARLSLTAGGNTISAGFLMARAEARCTDGGATTIGSSEIAELTINNESVVISGQPNQTIFLPTGRVVINEQPPAPPGNITVNALHVVVTGIADVVVSSAHADIGCPQPPPPPPPSCPDFTTGGGWITAPSGAKRNFAVAGGFKNGALWGHLNYIDHGGGPKVKGTGVTDYLVIDATTRRLIKGTAEINGHAGYTYEAEVADNGEPGRSDRFALTLSNGYSASGSLAGGNIQLHTCP
jgi:hypothetical protein